MKTCPIALKKIQDHFALAGITIIITPAEKFANPDGWCGPHGSLTEELTTKRPSRYIIEASDEVAIGFLIHEAMHTLLARPAWDHTFSGDVYNWTKYGTIPREEWTIIVYGRSIISELDIQEAATESAAEYEFTLKGKRDRVRWRQPGGSLLSHDGLGKATPETRAKAVKNLAAVGMVDEDGKLIGPFDLDVARENLDHIMECFVGSSDAYTRETILGLKIEVGSAVQKQEQEQIAA